MAILRQQSQALYFAIGLGSRLLRRAWLGWSLLCDCARVGLSLFQRHLCDIARFVHCQVIFVDFGVSKKNSSAAYPAVWEMYRRHPSLGCVLIAQEPVAQNGQTGGCVFLLDPIISLSVLAVD